MFGYWQVILVIWWYVFHFFEFFGEVSRIFCCPASLEQQDGNAPWLTCEPHWKGLEGWSNGTPTYQAERKLMEKWGKHAREMLAGHGLMFHCSDIFPKNIYGISIYQDLKKNCQLQGPSVADLFPKKQTWTTLCFHHGLMNFLPAIGENGWLALRVWTFYVLGPFNFVLICWFLNAETIPGTRNFILKKRENVYSIVSAVYKNIWYVRAHSISLLLIVRKKYISFHWRNQRIIILNRKI